MGPLNLHHLRCLWAVAREGGVAAAGKSLRLTHPTISAQVKALERATGTRLFERAGRGVALTDAGRVAQRYAEEIFALERELRDAFGGRATAGAQTRLTVGVADAVPKSVAHLLLAPAWKLKPRPRFVCVEGPHDRLLSALAAHDVDVVVSDAPVGPGARIKAHAHPLAEFPLAWYADAATARNLRGGFPRALDGAPVLLPTHDSALRRTLDAWFESAGIRPDVVAEFDDVALLHEFGRRGAGAFCAPAVRGPRVKDTVEVGRVPHLVARYFALSPERRVRHPAVAALTAGATG